MAHGGYTLQSESLLAGDDGTAQTVARIRSLVDSGKKDPLVNHTTGTILRDARVRPYDEHGEVRAIFKWVLRNIRFTKDPEGKECLRPARTTLEWGFGDCDDINAILLPSMLGTVGYHVRLVTIASHPAAPEQFSHVYCEAMVDSRWTAIDAARKNTLYGVAPGRSFRKRIWDLDADSYTDLYGLGCGRDCAMRLGTHYRVGRGALGRQYQSSGLGQFDWSQFSDIVGSVGKATTSIIGAAKAPGSFVYPSMPYGVSPYGVSPYGAPSSFVAPGSTFATGSISGNTLLFVGLGLAVVLLARR